MIRLALAALSLALAAPAAAVTYNFDQGFQGPLIQYLSGNEFDGSDGVSVASIVPYRSGQMSAAELRQRMDGANVANLVQTIQSVDNLFLRQSVDGVGTTISPGLGYSNDQLQIDRTSQRTEMMRVSFYQPGLFSLTAATFGNVGSVDTLSIYGVDASGTFHYLGFGGQFVAGDDDFGNAFTGGATGTRTQDHPASGKKYAVTFANIGGYREYWFMPDAATNGTGTSGFSLNSITVAPVPEPGEWAMILAGLALVGHTARKRRRQ